MTTILHQTLSHPSLHPPNFGILRGKKSLLLNLDIVVLADSGNVYDALFMAARVALWDTKVPRTKSVECKSRKGGPVMAGSAGETGDIDLETHLVALIRGRFRIPWISNFQIIGMKERFWAVEKSGRFALHSNLVPPIYYLDATLPEEDSTCLHLLLVFSFPLLTTPELQAIRLLGPGEVKLAQMKGHLKDGEQYARELFSALNVRLKPSEKLV